MNFNSPAKCMPGQYILNDACEPCPVDTYSEINLPTSTMMCMNCTDGNGTTDTGASSSSACQSKFIDSMCIQICSTKHKGLYEQYSSNCIMQ